MAAGTAEDLLRWLQANGADVGATRFPAMFSDEDGESLRGVAVGRLLKEGDVVFAVPASLLITPTVAADSVLGEVLRAEPGLAADPYLTLALFLALCAHEGPCSFFWPYVACLPSFADHARMPQLWTGEELAELQDCSVMQQLRAEAARWRYRYGKLSRCFEETFPHVAALQPSALSEERFLWAMLTVHTRSFHNQFRPGIELCLVPFADLLNHPPPGAAADPLDWQPEHQRVVMYARGARKEGEQLHNSYGPRKSCQALLTQYGFVSPTPTAPFLLDLAILPQSHKLRAMEERGWHCGKCNDSELLAYCRLAVWSDEIVIQCERQGRCLAVAIDEPMSMQSEMDALCRMQAILQRLLAGCPTSAEEDEALSSSSLAEVDAARCRQRLAFRYRLQWKRSLMQRLRFVELASALCRMLSKSSAACTLPELAHSSPSLKGLLLQYLLSYPTHLSDFWNVETLATLETLLN